MAIDTTDDPERVATLLRIHQLAAELAQERCPRLWQAAARAAVEVDTRATLVQLENRKLLKW